MRHRIKAHIGDIGWLALGALLGLAAVPLLVLLVVSVPTSLAAGVGVALFTVAVMATRGLARIQRRRLARDPDTAAGRRFRYTEVVADDEGNPANYGTPVYGWDPIAIYRAVPRHKQLSSRIVVRVTAWLRTTITDPQTWRDVAWLLCQAFVGVLSFVLLAGLWIAAVECVTAPLLELMLPKPTGFDPVVLELTGRSEVWIWILVPIGVGLGFQSARIAQRLVDWQARMGAELLGPRRREITEARLRWITAARSEFVDSSAAELRRIERDLHDGAQARLVSVAMSLGIADDVFDDNPTNARALLAEARADAGAALTELRSLVRGIHPPVLADRGLAGAIQALVLTSKLPVDLDLRLKRRLTPPVEAAAYFVLAESLVNAIRHSGAKRIKVSVVDLGPRLTMSVADDGNGGADPERGTGLLGIQRRLSAFDGSLRLDSPPGGPTVLDMDLPCKL
ncbi:sensor histidine kinase [Dactylosporangium sp. CS-033363]|uniref:sensor histidine kinase n=1 Tax=Dactylosporangium sp. CS-033363 TaxID=3239935 RepID=UPI003D8D1F8A